MKKPIASLILASLISGASALAQTDDDEIRMLIAHAPVARAIIKAEGLDALLVGNWLMALAYTGHTKEAFAAAAKIRKWMDEGEANSAIALGLAIRGKVDEALSLLRRTKDPSVQSAIVLILAKDGRFSEAQSEARKLDEDELYILQWVAREMAVRGEVVQAVSMVGEIKDENSLEDALRGVTEELLKAGKISEAKSFSEKMRTGATGYSPLQPAITEVVVDIARAGAQENALAIVDLIENEAERSLALSGIAKSFAKSGRFDEALETARKIKDEFHFPITLAEVAGEFTRKGKKDTARSLLNEAVGEAKRITDKKSREMAFDYMIPELAQSGMIDEALALAETFEDRHPIDAIAKAIAETGKTSSALKLLRSYGKKMPFPRNSVVAIVEKLAQAGKMNEVFEIRNDIPLSNAVDVAIVEGLLNAGKVEDALTVAQNIKDKFARSEAFADAAKYLLQSGSYKQARLAADSCPSPELRMGYYLKIFNELSFQRNPQLRERVKNYRLINVR